MRKLEVKKFGVVSSFKVTTYMMIVPAALCILAGVIMILVGVATQNKVSMIMGAVVTIVYPIVFIGLYGVISMLMALVYNLLAGKFGGMEMFVEEEKTDTSQVENYL